MMHSFIDVIDNQTAADSRRSNAASKPSVVPPKFNVGALAHPMAAPNVPGAVKAPRVRRKVQAVCFPLYLHFLFLWSLFFYDNKTLVMMVSSSAYSHLQKFFRSFVLPS
jgi:hypothetical protein